MTRIRRFPKEDKVYRRDRKHRYSLRVPLTLWTEIQELHINCGGSRAGASYNSLLEQLIRKALADPRIVSEIMRRYPEKPELIKIRTWGHLHES